MLPDVTKHTRATSFAHSIVRPLVKPLPLVCAGLQVVQEHGGGGVVVTNGDPPGNL